MRRYTITYNPSEINFRPSSELEEIFQNINTILGTVKFSVPFLRDFGLKAESIDKPMNIVIPIYMNEVIEAVEKYEPRVLVEEIEFEADIEGHTYPKIIFSLKDEGEETS